MILASAAAILYLFPARTELMWAWPMSPDMSPLTVGGGYLAGAAFFVLAVRAGRWHEMAVGLLCAAVLTALLLAATVLHWGRFSHGNPAFWLWFAIYLVTPAYLPWLWASPGTTRVWTATPGRSSRAGCAASSVQSGSSSSPWPSPSSRAPSSPSRRGRGSSPP